MPKSSSHPPAGGRPAAKSAEPATPVRVGKREQILALLADEAGATIAEIIAVTGWQPHSARAMLSMLRKDGHTINRVRRDTGESCYRLEARG